MTERILAFMVDMESNDYERVSKWFAESASLWIPPAKPVHGDRRIRALFRAMFGKYEYVSWEIAEILTISENRTIHICDSRGKMKGMEPYENRVITDISWNDEGKIVSLSDYFKDTCVFMKSCHAKP